MKRTVLDTDKQTERILAICKRATVDEWNEGLAWYRAGHSQADMLRELAQGFGHNITTMHAAGIIAALSPQNAWEQNLKDAHALVRGKACSQTRANVDKASSILRGTHPCEVLGRDARAQKALCFFDNLAFPNESLLVTIDRHALAIAEGLMVTNVRTKTNMVNVLRRVGVYEQISEAYANAASVLGVRPLECQAIAWVTWKALRDAIMPPQTLTLSKGL
jgi:uncharacterized protein YfkK (UPF0435 family)